MSVASSLRHLLSHHLLPVQRSCSPVLQLESAQFAYIGCIPSQAQLGEALKQLDERVRDFVLSGLLADPDITSELERAIYVRVLGTCSHYEVLLHLCRQWIAFPV